MSQPPPPNGDPSKADQSPEESGSLWQSREAISSAPKQNAADQNSSDQAAGADAESPADTTEQAPEVGGALFNQMLGRRSDESQQAMLSEEDEASDASDASDASAVVSDVAPEPVTQTSGGGNLKPIVRLVNIYKAFGSLKVLEGVSLDIYPGKTAVIIGPSGTGKSVLLKIICGLLKPDSGEVWFNDQRVDKLPEKELVNIRKKMGMLFQMGALFDSMTVGDNITFPLLEHNQKMSAAERLERGRSMIKVVGLKDVGNKMPADLSGGQRKRVALARAIILEPELVLYDEPTTGLDPIRSDIINELILGLTRRLGLASIVVTHDMISADKIADRMVMLYDGKVVIDATPTEFHQSDNDLVRRFILGQADADELAAIREGIEPVAGK